MKRQQLLLLTSAIGSQMFFSKAMAQVTEPDSTLAEQLEEVTIKAVRARELAPVPKVTATQKEIEKVYTGQDAAFLLEELSPSIVSYSQSGTSLSNYGYMRLRGIDQTRINITLNGVPLNDMIDQGVFFSNFIDFGNSLQSVQIQRGVGTSTNGVASYAGSINFESTSLTQSKPSSEIQLTGGSFGTLRGSAEVSTGLMENNTSFYARMSHVQSDGYRYNTGTNSNSLFFSGGVFGEKHALRLTGFAGASSNELSYTPTALSDIERNPRINYISPNDIEDFGQYLFQLQHTYRLSTRTSLVSTAYYGGAGGDFLAGSDASGSFQQINYPLYNHHIGLMSFVNHEAQDGISGVSGGLHGYSFLRNNIEYIVPNRDAPYYDDHSRKDEISAFVKGQKAFGNLLLFADVQVRAVRLMLSPDEAFLGQEVSVPARDYLFVNPKAGVTYRMSDEWNAYASFGRSGREPARTDILGGFQVNQSNLHLVLNPESVEPEYVNDLEAGVRVGKENLKLNANYFYMAFENEIAPIGEYVSEGFIQVHLNQEPSFRTGLEVDGEWQFLPQVSFGGHLTYLHAQISEYSPSDTSWVYEDVTPVLSPKWNMLGRLTYEPIQGLRFSLSARYLSESYIELTNNPDFTVPESLIYNLDASWNFWGEHSVSVQFNNITDELYYTYGAPHFDGTQPAYFVQPPRHVYATLSLRF